MVAHHTGGVVVVGSNPATPTKHKKTPAEMPGFFYAWDLAGAERRPKSSLLRTRTGDDYHHAAIRFQTGDLGGGRAGVAALVGAGNRVVTVHATGSDA